MSDRNFKTIMHIFALFALTMAWMSWWNILQNSKENDITVTLEKIPLAQTEKYAPVERPRVKKGRSDKTVWGMYSVPSNIKMSDNDLNCLAKNIYHEAAFEPYIGKMSIAQITYNRVKEGRWGKTFCKVVYSKSQFSWTLKPELRKEVPRGPHWRASVQAAKSFVNGTRVAKLESSDHYHATYVSPKWNKKMTKTAKVGHHIFYANNE